MDDSKANNLELNQEKNYVNDSSETIYVVSNESNYQSIIDQTITVNSVIDNQLTISPNDPISNQAIDELKIYFQNQSNQDEKLTDKNNNTKQIDSKNIEEIRILEDKKDILLNLKWSFRDSLINYLNSFSAILSGKSISNEEKEEMSKQVDNSMLELTNLPLRFDKIKKRKNSDDSKQMKKKIKLEPVLDLTTETRINLVDQLITNRNLSIKYKDNISDEIKKTLVNENNEFVKFLLELPVGYIEEDLDDGLIKISSKDENDLDFKLNNIRSEFHNKLMDIDICKNQTNFTFKLNDIRNFFSTDNTIYSEFFYCRGIPWYLCIKSRLEPNSKNDSTKHLEIYIHPKNNDPTNWRIKCYYEISLLSNFSELLKDKTKSATHIYNKKFGGNGFKEFCTFKELVNYIDNHDDSVKIKVFLKADALIRTN